MSFPLIDSPSVVPLTVMRSKCKMPRSFWTSFKMAGMPPARWTSSMCQFPEGETLQICGTFSATSLIRAIVYGTSASCAKAKVCKTVFVEPPIAISRAKASSNASAVTISRGLMSFSKRVIICLEALSANSSRSGVVARAVPLKGKAKPKTSIRQFIELAVNIPEQEPQEGQARCSSIVNSSSSIFPAENAPTPSKTETKSIASPSGVLPAGIGPPETKIVGILTRIAPIIMPGTILSQFGMQTIASNWWASIIVSTESAISSREGSEYFIPPCPIAIPSSTPMVLNSKGTPPAARTASLTISPNDCK